MVFYLTGVGSMPRYPGMSNAILSTVDHYLGGIWGAGFENNIEAALHFLGMNYRPGDELYIFGFSRGAATARGLSQFLAWSGGLPKPEDNYYLPLLFHEFIHTRGAGSAADWVADYNRQLALASPPRKPIAPFMPAPIHYLGVWDTVMALGSRFRANEGTSTAEP